MKLAKRDVLFIFSQRAQVNTHESNALTSRQIATKFGISERTVRDIWSRRSRRNLTQSAWTVEEVVSDTKCKRVGRPPGAKDSEPRQRSSRTSGSEQETTSSDGGTARQSDTTGSSRNKNTSQEENSSSNSNQENSSSESGDSSPQPRKTSRTSPAPPCECVQNARNERLNQVLSLLHNDWKNGATANMPVPKQDTTSPSSAAQNHTLKRRMSQDASHLHSTPFRMPQPLAWQWKNQDPSQTDPGLQAPEQHAPGYASNVAHQSSSFGTHIASNVVSLASNNIYRQETFNFGSSSSRPFNNEWFSGQAFPNQRAPDASTFGASMHQSSAPPSQNYVSHFGQQHHAHVELTHPRASQLSHQPPPSTPTNFNVISRCASLSPHMHSTIPPAPTPTAESYHAWCQSPAPPPQLHGFPTPQCASARRGSESLCYGVEDSTVPQGVLLPVGRPPPYNLATNPTARYGPAEFSSGVKAGGLACVYGLGQPGVVGAYIQRTQSQVQPPHYSGYHAPQTQCEPWLAQPL